jgi:hypothetical protein
MGFLTDNFDRITGLQDLQVTSEGSRKDAKKMF